MKARPDWLSPETWMVCVRQADPDRVTAALHASDPDVAEFAVLLSEPAAHELEAMARRAQGLTRRHFGRTVSLYAPLYLSNACSGGCAYCGFASDRRQHRSRLSPGQLTDELRALKRMGFEEILLLTGERTADAGFAYLLACVRRAARDFHKITVESFAMTEVEYGQLVEAGCTGVTLYQETYDPRTYNRVHRWGPKRDYAVRLDAPDRALRAGMRTFGIGSLFGLAEPRMEAMALYQHARYLRKTYWQAGITISFPRLRPEPGAFQPIHPVDQRLLAQIIFAFRICLPDVPLVLSTREAPAFRNGMAGVGISKMSVASRTTVGGYAAEQTADNGQFQTADTRDIAAFCGMLRNQHLEPVFKDWDAVYR
jgi:2-iminoacetate synthase